MFIGYYLSDRSVLRDRFGSLEFEICQYGTYRRSHLPRFGSAKTWQRHMSLDESSFSDGPALTKDVPALDIGYGYCV